MCNVIIGIFQTPFIIIKVFNETLRDKTTSKIRHKDIRLSSHAPPVHHAQNTLDSETGWTGESWSKTNLLK